MDEKKIKDALKKRYTEVAKKTTECCKKEGIKMGKEKAVTYGYDKKDLEWLPETFTESFAGCGNPFAIGEIREGDVVLDLGSGAGLDCFLASKRVGVRGKVIGLDMTDAMLKKAKKNIETLGIKNIEFKKGEMEKIPLENESVDVIISNCVINLSPDKDAVFREAYRVLRYGGRLMISDIVTDKELPDEIKKDLSLWVTCIGGAIPEDEYLDKIRKAGFVNVEVIDKKVSSKINCWSIKVRALKDREMR